MPLFQIPPPNAPFLQEKGMGYENKPSRDWYRYFIELNAALNLFFQSSGTDPSSIFPNVNAGIEEANTEGFSVLNAFPVLEIPEGGIMPPPSLEVVEEFDRFPFPFLPFCEELPESGIYTPTLTNVANLDGSTAYPSNYTKVGDMVMVFGQFSADPTTTATVTKLGVSLPILTNLSNVYDLGGVASALALAGQSAGIQADTTNDRASVEWLAGDTTNKIMTFMFSYRL